MFSNNYVAFLQLPLVKQAEKRLALCFFIDRLDVFVLMPISKNKG